MTSELVTLSSGDPLIWRGRGEPEFILYQLQADRRTAKLRMITPRTHMDLQGEEQLRDFDPQILHVRRYVPDRSEISIIAVCDAEHPH